MGVCQRMFVALTNGSTQDPIWVVHCLGLPVTPVALTTKLGVLDVFGPCKIVLVTRAGATFNLSVAVYNTGSGSVLVHHWK